jgi:hypothetical protein
MTGLQIFAIALVLGLAGYWLFDFITTGAPSMIWAMITMAVGVGFAIGLTRGSKTEDGADT